MESVVKISKKLVVVNATSTALTRLFSAGLLLWMQYYLLHRISPEEFSIYPLTSILILFLPLVSSILQGSSYRYITAAWAEGDRERVTTIISTLTPVLAAAGLVLLFLGFAACYYVDRIFVIAPQYVSDARTMMALLLLAGVYRFLLGPFTAGIYALQRNVLNNMILLSGEILKVTTLCILLLGVSPRVLWIAVAHFVSSVLVTTVQTFWSRRMIPEISFSRKSIDRGMVRELVGFGFGMFAFGLSRFLRGAAPLWILNRFGTAVDVTTYHLGQTAYRQTVQAWSPIRQNVGPPLIAMNARNETGRMRQAYYRGSRIGLWLIMFIGTPLIVFHDDVMRLYAGETYAMAGTVMVLLLLRFPLQIMNTMLPPLARAKAETRPLAIVSLSTELASIAAILLVVWGYEQGAIMAATCALAVSSLSELFLVWPVALRLINGTRRGSIRKSLIPGITPAAVSGPALYLGSPYLDSSTWGGLFLSISIGWLLYAAVTFMSLQPEDRKDLHRLREKINRRKRPDT